MFNYSAQHNEYRLLKSTRINLHSNYLWFLTLTYTMAIIFANWFAPRLIHCFGLDTDAGTLVFPITFLLSDLITEIYGFKYARRAIWCGFLFNLFFILYAQIVIHMPGPAYQTTNEMFDTILAANVRIIFASAISYLIAEPLNSIIMAKLKIKMQGHYLPLRFISSTFFSSALDSCVFCVIAFYGKMSNANLLIFILSMWIIKTGIETLGVPLSTWLAKKLKKIESIDMYDNHTKFNLFSLDTTYSTTDNHFKRN